MTGLLSTLGHILPICSLWLFAMILIGIVRIFFLKKVPEPNRVLVNKIIRYVICGITAVAFIYISGVLLFLSNPLERKNIKTIPEATVSESFKEQTKKEVEVLNRELEEGKHIEKGVEAERDNTQAMEEASKIFGEAEKEVKQ